MTAFGSFIAATFPILSPSPPPQRRRRSHLPCSPSTTVMTTPLPISPIETDIEMLFKQVVAKDVDESRAGSQMPTPPHTPLTPPPMVLMKNSDSNTSIPERRVGVPLPESRQPRNHPDDNTLVSISTSFHPSAGHCGSLPPDLVFLSADSVFFYVHSTVIGPATNNHFGGFLENKGNNPAEKHTRDDGEHVELIVLPDQSPVLNIILHILYNISPAHHSPPFAAIATAVDRIHTTYGIDVKALMQGSALGISVIPAHITTLPPRQLHESLLFSLISSHAPLYPIEVYALAASMDCLPLARIASTYLHGLDICPSDESTITSNKLKLSPILADKIGGVYLSRLVGLHRQRLDALRAAVCVPPDSHVPVEACKSEIQSALRRAWALAAAFVIYTAGPDFSAQLIDSTFRPLTQHLSCILCRNVLEDRIEAVKKEWGAAPRTI